MRRNNNKQKAPSTQNATAINLSPSQQRLNEADHYIFCLEIYRRSELYLLSLLITNLLGNLHETELYAYTQDNQSPLMLTSAIECFIFSYLITQALNQIHKTDMYSMLSSPSTPSQESYFDVNHLKKSILNYKKTFKTREFYSFFVGILYPTIPAAGYILFNRPMTAISGLILYCIYAFNSFRDNKQKAKDIIPTQKVKLDNITKQINLKWTSFDNSLTFYCNLTSDSYQIKSHTLKRDVILKVIKYAFSNNIKHAVVKDTIYACPLLNVDVNQVKTRFEQALQDILYLKKNKKRYYDVLNQLNINSNYELHWYENDNNEDQISPIFKAKSNRLTSLSEDQLRQLTQLIEEYFKPENVTFVENRLHINITDFSVKDFSRLKQFTQTFSQHNNVPQVQPKPLPTQRPPQNSSSQGWFSYYSERAASLFGYVPTMWQHRNPQATSSNVNTDNSNSFSIEKLLADADPKEAIQAPFYDHEHLQGYVHFSQKDLAELPDNGRYFVNSLQDNINCKHGRINRLKADNKHAREQGYTHKMRLFGYASGNERAFFKPVHNNNNAQNNSEETHYELHLDLRHMK